MSPIVDTHFFVNQPRESEEMRDVYVSPSAIGTLLWTQLDNLVLGKVESILSKHSTTTKDVVTKEKKTDTEEVKTKKSDTTSTTTTNENKSDEKSNENINHQERRTSLAEPYPAAESSPSPAAQGPGTPSTPYGTPPPFASSSILSSRKLHGIRGSHSRSGVGDEDEDEINSSNKTGGAKSKDDDEDDDEEIMYKGSQDIPSAKSKSTSNSSSFLPKKTQPQPQPSSSVSSNRSPLVDGPPGFEDEYEIGGSLTDSRLGINPNNNNGSGSRLGYGERDLYPPGLGPHPELNPLGGIGGLGGIRGGGGFGSGGMNPTGQDIENMIYGQPNSGSGSGGGFPLNRPPPGARYDPTNPGDLGEGGMGGIGGRRGFGSGSGGFPGGGFPGGGGFGNNNNHRGFGGGFM